MAASKDYKVNVSTQVDEKTLNALIKKLQNLKSKVAVGTEIDDKEIKKLQKQIADIGKKPVEIKIDTSQTKKDLSTIERQIDNINTKAKSVKSGGVVNGVAPSVVSQHIGALPIGSASLGTATTAAVIASTVGAKVGTGTAYKYLEELQKKYGTKVGNVTLEMDTPASTGNVQSVGPQKPGRPIVPTPTPTAPAQPTTPVVSSSGVKQIGGALIGMEVFEKLNEMMGTVATNYDTVANRIQSTNSELADSLRKTSQNIKDTMAVVKGVASGGVLGGALFGAKGGIYGAAIGGSLAFAMKAFNEYQTAMIDVTESEANLIGMHEQLSEAFNERQAIPGQKMLESYNDTLQNTIDLENELTSVKLHAQDEELAGAFDIIQLEKQRIENKKKLISDSGRPEAQKIREISALNQEQDALERGYQFEEAGAPVKRLKTTLSGLSNTFTPIVASLQETADKFEKVKKLNAEISAIDSKQAEVESRLIAIRGNKYRAGELPSTERQGRELQAEKKAIQDELRKYATQEQLQGEINSLQSERDALQKQIISKGQELDLAITTEARVKANLAAQGLLQGQTRGIERVSQLSTASTDVQLQARLETGVSSLVNTITGVSETFERLKVGTGVSRGNELSNLENAISEAIKDGIISVKDFNPIYNKAQSMGIGNDPGIKDILDRLRKIAEVQLRVGTGGNVNVAGQSALKELDVGGQDKAVADYIRQIIKDREINAEELAGLQELLSNSNAKGLEVITRLLSVAESNLTSNNQLIDRIAKIEAGLKLVNTKLK